MEQESHPEKDGAGAPANEATRRKTALSKRGQYLQTPKSRANQKLSRGLRPGGTKKRRGLLQAAIKYPGATQEELAKKAGMTRSGVAKALAAPSFQQAVAKAMEAMPELCQSARLKRLAMGVWARRAIKNAKGEVVSSEDDLQTSRPYLEMACKMAGDLKTAEDGPVGDRISLAILILNERERRGLEPMPAKFLEAAQRAELSHNDPKAPSQEA